MVVPKTVQKASLNSRLSKEASHEVVEKREPRLCPIHQAVLEALENCTPGYFHKQEVLDNLARGCGEAIRWDYISEFIRATYPKRCALVGFLEGTKATNR